MTTQDCYDIIIIGGGCAGFAGAMYAGRMQLKTLVLAETRGGTLLLTDDVSNYPGFKKLTGAELTKNIEEHALEYDIDVVDARAIAVKKQGQGFIVNTKKKQFATKTIIFATGTKIRKLGCPGEDTYANKGVHYCALCDGAFYKNKIMGVVGGSDSAAKEALLLTQWAKKVYIIYRGDEIHPEPINYEKIKNNNKIEIITNTNVTEIKGTQFMDRVILDKPYNGNKELLLDAIFIEIGHIPLSELAEPLGVTLNKKKEIIINRNAETNIPGIWAAGDVADTEFKQAITGVGEAVAAVYGAYKYLNENAIVCPVSDEITMDAKEDKTFSAKKIQ